MKTNNTLALVITVIVLLVAGYFLLKNPQAVTPLVVPNNDSTVVSGDSIFTDQAKTFSFSYPKKYSISNNGIVTIPKSFQAGTNFSEAIFLVNDSQASLDVKNCLIATNGEQSKGLQTIKGINYTKITLSDAGAGNFYDRTSYRTLRNNHCYSIEYTIHSTNIGAYSPDQGIKEFDKVAVVNLLEAMVRNVNFLTSDVTKVSVTPLQVLEDSRCPIYAKCVWMGTVKLKVKVTNKVGVSAEDVLTLNEPKTIAGVVVTLTDVMPAKTDKALVLSDYTFTFSTK